MQLKSLYFGGKEKIAAVISEKEYKSWFDLFFRCAVCQAKCVSNKKAALCMGRNYGDFKVGNNTTNFLICFCGYDIICTKGE